MNWLPKINGDLLLNLESNYEWIDIDNEFMPILHNATNSVFNSTKHLIRRDYLIAFNPSFGSKPLNELLDPWFVLECDGKYIPIGLNVVICNIMEIKDLHEQLMINKNNNVDIIHSKHMLNFSCSNGLTCKKCRQPPMYAACWFWNLQMDFTNQS